MTGLKKEIVTIRNKETGCNQIVSVEDRRIIAEGIRVKTVDGSPVTPQMQEAAEIILEIRENSLEIVLSSLHPVMTFPS